MVLQEILTDATENAQYVPITNGTYAFVVLYSVPVQVVPTDNLIILAQAELSNPYNFKVGLGRYISRCVSPTDAIGKRVAPATMENVTSEMHHKVILNWAIDTGASGLVYYNYVAYAVGMGNCGNMIVEQGYGKLSVMKFVR